MEYGIHPLTINVVLAICAVIAFMALVHVKHEDRMHKYRSRIRYYDSTFGMDERDARSIRRIFLNE